MAYRPFLLASAAASAFLPTPAHAASNAGLPGSPGAPVFNCGTASLRIAWGVGGSGQPQLSYIDSLGNAGETFSFGCDSKGNFLQTLARKSGEGQKDLLKVTFKEAFVSSYKISGELKFDSSCFHKGSSSLSGSECVIQQLGFLNGKPLPLELGFKYRFDGNSFLGDASFKFSTETNELFAFIPLKESEGQLSLFSPAAVPEPETWASMLLGFAAAGSAMRAKRRRRRVRAW